MFLEAAMDTNNYDEINAYDEALAKKEYQELLNAYNQVLETEPGQMVLWHILAECGIYDGGFVAGEMAQFNQGMREIGLRVIGTMHDADPAAYANLQLREV